MKEDFISKLLILGLSGRLMASNRDNGIEKEDRMG